MRKGNQHQNIETFTGGEINENGVFNFGKMEKNNLEDVLMMNSMQQRE